MKHYYRLNDIRSNKNIGLRTKNHPADGDAHYLILADYAKNIQLITYLLFIIVFCMLLFINISKASAHTNLTQRTIAHLVNAQRVQGNPDANVTIVVYTDFQCYWCRKFEELDLPYLIKNYINTGKVYLIYRDFPLTLIHPFAFKAAKYADCSALQSTKHNNKYLKIRSLLYKYQSKWSTIGDIYYFLKKNDKGLLNMKKEQSCVKHNVTVGLIKQNIKKGTMLGVTGTPTLFIYKGLELVKTIRGYQPIGKLNKLLQKIAG